MSEQNKEKTCWFVRLGEIGQHDDDALKENVITIDFGITESPEVFKGKDHHAIRDIVEEKFQDLTKQKLAKIASPINMLVNFMNKGDIVVCPFKTLGGQIYIGEIVGECEQNKARLLTRKVKWLVGNSLSRDRFQKDLLNSFTANLTIFKINRRDVFKRLKEVADNSGDINFKDKGADPFKIKKDQAAEGGEVEYAVRDLAPVEIEERIFERFAGDGYGLEKLVNEIMKAKGYETYYSSKKGPDGGVDIIAGKGELGFGQPRIVIQVKAGGVNTFSGNDVFNKLAKTVKTYSADYGLFVSWKGFSDNIYLQSKDEFFKIRLWDRNKIMSELFKVYDKLPQDIQNELPLKSILVLDHDLNSDS